METLISLIKHLKSKGVLRNKKVLDAFIKIDRKNFIPKHHKDQSYEDIPLPI